MNDLQIFKNNEFGEVSTLVVNNEPMFVGKDVAIALGYSNPRKAIIDHVDDEDKGVTKRDTLGGEQTITVINESGLYSLILSSKLPTAKKFKRWITSEVLPTIRRVGSYSLSMPQTFSEALYLAAKQQERIEEQQQLLLAQGNQITEMQGAIKEMQPKVNYCDVILQSPSTVTVTQIAQDYGMSAKAFNKLLHTIGVQRKVGRQWVLYAKYIANGYVQSHTELLQNSSQGRTFTYSQWTQKGRIFLYHELKNRNILPLIEQEDEPIKGLTC